MNDNIKSLCTATSIAYTPTQIAHSHEKNAFIERANKEVLRHIRNFCQDRGVQGDWTRAIPAVQFIINTTMNSVTGYTPHELLFGPASNLQNFLVAKPPTIPQDVPDQSTERVKWWEEQQQVHETIIKAAVTLQKELDDQHRAQRTPKQLTTYDVGSYVLVSYPSIIGEGRGRAPTKLHTILRGPLKILERDNAKYTLLDLVTRRTEVVHVSRLYPFQYDSTRTDPDKIAYLDKNEFVVEKIIDSTIDDNIPKTQWQFLVRWEGYGEEDDLWLSWNELKHVKALHNYLRDNGHAKAIPHSHQQLSDKTKLPKKVTFSPEVYHNVDSSTMLPSKKRRQANGGRQAI